MWLSQRHKHNEPPSCLESFIREAFIKKEHVAIVFFDLEKAYETPCKNEIRRDLHGEVGY